jgi:hypothetical protein
MNEADTFAERLGVKLDALKSRGKDYEQLLSQDFSNLGRALAWRVLLALASLILAVVALTLAGVSVLLSASIEGLDWRVRPATWAVPLAFFLGSIAAGLTAVFTPRRPPMAATRLRLADDVARVDQRTRVVVRDVEDRLVPVRRLWKDVESLGVVGTASQGVREAVHQWWQRQPIQPAATSAAQEARRALEPLAKSHPWLLLSLAAATGTVIATLMPRRWLRELRVSVRAAARPWVAALGPAMLSKVVSGVDLGTLVSVFARAAESTAKDAPSPAPKPTA